MVLISKVSIFLFVYNYILITISILIGVVFLYTYIPRKCVFCKKRMKLKDDNTCYIYECKKCDYSKDTGIGRGDNT